MGRRLLIDLEVCDGCAACTARCAYFYRPHPEDHGIDTLRERGTFALLCRRCPEPTCVRACAFSALERQPDGTLQRHNLRCVSCKLCAHACPFGIIDPALLGFYETPCDFCVRSLEATGGPDQPPCVGSCGRSAVAYRTIAPSELAEGDLHLLGDHLAVRARAWPHEAEDGP